MNPELFEKLVFWITERERIREQKELGLPRPWTEDPVLQQFKFCNVRREHDRVTKWFAQVWRHPDYWDQKNFVPAIILGRIINWPATLAEIGFPFEWDKSAVFEVLEERKRRGDKVYTGAYMVSQYGSKMAKNTLVVANAHQYFTKLPMVAYTLEKTASNLQEYEGIGPFMAGQVVADLKQTKHLVQAPDWWDWAILGPGSTRGLNRLYGRPVNFNLSQGQGLAEMRAVKAEFSAVPGVPVLCLQDIQNCMCEFDKYMRVLMGQGLPRARYDGYGP